MRLSNYIILLTILFLACDQMAFVPEETSDYFKELGFITVTSPKGGEIWNMGSTQTISWSCKNINSEQFKIDLYKGEDFIYEIGIIFIGTMSGTATFAELLTGSYNWNIRNSLTESDNYKIRISEYNIYENKACRDHDGEWVWFETTSANKSN